MVVTAVAGSQQLPLIIATERDDAYLGDAADVAWYRTLRDFDWHPLRLVAAQYYEALWHFNDARAAAQSERATLAAVEAAKAAGMVVPPAPIAAAKPAAPDPVPAASAAIAGAAESQEEAAVRLAQARPTEKGTGPLIAPAAPRTLELLHVKAGALRPGIVPRRLAGRKAKCFFAMAKAYVGATLRGRAAEAGAVHDELTSNPAFARVCGFTLPVARAKGRLPAEYAQSDIPSLRKLEQFDQIMTSRGLWGHLALGAVRRNLESGKLRGGDTLVHDTTHLLAASQRDVVDLPPEKPDGKPRRKSQPRTTKECRCADRAKCQHAWRSADAGAGTVVKGPTSFYWAHKVSTLCFAGQEILIDAVAMTDGAANDVRSVMPHLERFFGLFPDLREMATRLLDDAAADNQDLKAKVRADYGIELLTPANPRQRKEITKDLPRGVSKIGKRGTPVCEAGVPMDFRGCRHATRTFLFSAPDTPAGEPVCAGCPLKESCLREGATRRHISIPFDRLPHINPAMPQLSERFARAIAQRTVIERVHNLMKHVYGEPRLKRRGTPAVQAALDKLLWGMHLALAET